MVDYLFIHYINNVAPAFSSAVKSLSEIITNSQSVPGNIFIFMMFNII